MMARQALRDESGSASLELVIVTPIFIMGFVLLAFAFGMIRTSGAVSDVAAEVATAASRADRFSLSQAAVTEGQRIASQQGLPCTEAGGIFVRGDIVTVAGAAGTEALQVTVRCTVPNSKLGVRGAPGSQTFESIQISPIDEWRGGD